MKYFAIFSGVLLVLYLAGFVKKQNSDFPFMSRDFITAIKGFSILTVVWAHTGARLGVSGIQFIAGVGVALFLICSGYGLEMSYQKNGLKGFWRKRFLKVCIPFWIMSLIGPFLLGIFTLKSFALSVIFVQPTVGGWYLQYIAICYILFWGVKMVASKLTKIQEEILIVGVFLIWFVIDSLFFANSDMPFLRARQMLSFQLGMILAQHNDIIENLFSKKVTSLKLTVGGYDPYLFSCWSSSNVANTEASSQGDALYLTEPTFSWHCTSFSSGCVSCNWIYPCVVAE